MSENFSQWSKKFHSHVVSLDNSAQVVPYILLMDKQNLSNTQDYSRTLEILVLMLTAGHTSLNNDPLHLRIYITSIELGLGYVLRVRSRLGLESG